MQALRITVALLAVCLLCGCGGGSGSGAGNGSGSPALAGLWKQPPPVPGSSYEMTLSGSGASITGSGTQLREAGTPRNFNVSGQQTGSTFTLTLTFTDDNSTATYSGQFVDSTHLTGTLAPAGQPGTTVTFTKQ